MFHGVVLLPVILSLIGPEPYLTKELTDIERNNQKYLEEDEVISFIHTKPVNQNGDTTASNIQPNGNEFVTQVDIEEMEKLSK